MPIYPIIPKTPASKGKGKESPSTMPIIRTTRSRAAASNQDTPDAGAGSSKIPQTTRKPPTRSNQVEKQEPPKQTPIMKRITSLSIMNKTARSTSTTQAQGDSTGTETMQAFLRIRPPPNAHELSDRVKPYLEMQGDKQVIMRAPQDLTRPNQAPKPTQIYSFNRVFGPSISQNTFFETTTLPLVEQALQGESGLMFSYGVSNSGKTYTIQGGGDDKTDGADRGMIPRSIDVIFNSIEGLECSSCVGYHVQIKPVRQYGVEIGTGVEEDRMSEDFPLEQYRERYKDQTTIKVDRNYSYAVYLSYVEVYNEKIFDLLEGIPSTSSKGQSAKPAVRASSTANRNSTVLQRSFSQAFGAFGNRMSLAATANGGNGVIKRQALALKNDLDGGKYVAGLKEIRVRTREEAHAIFKLGQIDRQVFGTGQNQQSSRSHGIFTVKIVKIHNGAPNDPESAQVSRLSIVDLAGSERTKNTHNAGDRLREAANINTSLMTLGQCMETLRANQALLMDRSMQGKRKPAIVPFRHSKLTEMFQGFFAGQGRAVMIVHVNPYDTGFDENSHVMRFSSIARAIQTTAFNKMSIPIFRGIDAFRNAVTPMKVRVPVTVMKPAQGLAPSSEPHLVEEEMQVQEVDPEDESDNEEDLLVRFLFSEIKELRIKLVEAEMRNATLEAEIREEASAEMAQHLQRLETMYTKRLQEQSDASELKTDMKIDIMQRGMGSMADQYEETGPVDSDSSLLEAAIDRSLMADDDEEMSGRTDTTTTNGEGSSRSYTASPTPASRLPVFNVAVGSVQAKAEVSIEISSLQGVRFAENVSTSKSETPEDHDMNSVSSGETDNDSDSAVSMRSAKSDHTETRVEARKPAEGSDAKHADRSRIAVSFEPGTAEQGQRPVYMERSQPHQVSDDEGEDEETHDVESDRSSELSSSETEEDELEDSEDDSSFEAASESSDDDLPVPQSSRRRSSAAHQSSAKARKSTIATAPSAIPETLEEEEDVIVPKSVRQSVRPSKGKRNDVAEKEQPSTRRSHLTEIQVQKSPVPVDRMADLQLDENLEVASSEKASKPEPARKKKRKLGKAVAITEEEIEQEAARLNLNGGGNVRRMVQRV